MVSFLYVHVCRVQTLYNNTYNKYNLYSALTIIYYYYYYSRFTYFNNNTCTSEILLLFNHLHYSPTYLSCFSALVAGNAVTAWKSRLPPLSGIQEDNRRLRMTAERQTRRKKAHCPSQKNLYVLAPVPWNPGRIMRQETRAVLLVLEIL